MTDHQANASIPVSEMPEHTYRAYLDERGRLIEGEKDVGKDYDKYLLTMSGGTIALTLTLLKDAPKETAFWPLLIGWIFLSSSMLSILIALLVNPMISARFRASLDAEAMLGGDRYWARVRERQKNCKLSKFVWRLNFAGLLLLMAGIGFILGFAALRMKENNMTPHANAVQQVQGHQTATSQPDGQASCPAPLAPVDRVTSPPPPSQPASPPASSPTK